MKNLKKFALHLKHKKTYFTMALLKTAEQLEWTHPLKSPELSSERLSNLKKLILLGNIEARYRNCKCGMRPCKDNAAPLLRVVRHLPALELLIAAGADLEARNNQGKTALLHAIERHRDIPLLEHLIKTGADVNAISWTGWAGWPRGWRILGSTPLMSVVQHSSEKNMSSTLAVIDLLLQAGADVNKRNKKGETALLFAVKRNERLPLVHILRAAGADPTARNILGKSVLDYATPEIAMILRQD